MDMFIHIFGCRYYNLCSPESWTNESLATFNVERIKYNGTKFPSCSCDKGSLECADSISKNPIPVFKVLVIFIKSLMFVPNIGL